MAKRKKKRVKSEPKAPTWVVFKCFNQTRQEVCFGISTNCPKWGGNRNELSRIPELAHWDTGEDKIMILRIGKRTCYKSPSAATYAVNHYERTYTHPRNFWVVQTGSNTLLTPRERKPIRPAPLPRGFYAYMEANAEKNEETKDVLQEDEDADD
jgi:hypothetical protein